MSHFFSDPDPEFQLAGVQAYNNWLAQEIMKVAPDRLIGLAAMPALGVEAAITEMERCLKLGFRGVWLNTMPSVGDDDPPRGRSVLGRGAGARRAGPLPRARHAAAREAEAEGRARRRPRPASPASAPPT